MKRKKKLASQLNNRIEIWKPESIESDIGEVLQNVFFKKIWADIIPINGSQLNGIADTEYSDTNFKIKIRKASNNEITNDNFIMFRGLRYDIKYILPDFNNGAFNELFTKLKTE